MTETLPISADSPAMGVRFLSEQYMTDVTTAMSSREDIRRAAAGFTLGINYLVTDGPNGDFTYHIRVADGTATMALGELEEADALIRSSYGIAAGISRGEINNQMAVMTGKIKIKGAMTRLIKHTSLLNMIQAGADGMDIDY